ncbi:MAG: FlgD immunoglobulin-like domain containing protein [Bacteroidota bacterium]
MLRISLAGGLALLLFAAPALHAQDAPPPPLAAFDQARSVAEAGGAGSLEISARWPYGYVRSVAFAGDTPVAMQGSVFQTLDLSTPGEIGIVGELVLPGVISDMAASGDLVAVMTTHFEDAETGLFVIDVSDPALPTRRGKLTGVGGTAITIRGEMAYIGTFEAVEGPQRSLRVVSLENPDAPTVLGTVEVPGVTTDLMLSGSHAYLAMGLDGLAVVDVSTPSVPSVASTPVADYMAAVAAAEVEGQTVLATVVQDADDADQVRFYSLAMPDAPAFLGEAPLRSELVFGPVPMDLVWTENDRLVVGSGFGGLQFVDAADPADPNVRPRERTNVANVASGTSRLATDGTTVLIADAFSGLHVADAATRTLTAFHAVPNLSLDVEVDGGTVYVAHGTYGVVRLQRAAGLSGETLTFDGRAHGPAWNYTSDLAQSETHLYAADGFGGVQVVDKTTLETTATVLASATAPVRRVAVTSDGLSLLAGIGGADDPLTTDQRVVYLYSLANPASPSFVGSFVPPVGVGDLDGTGPFVWVADLFGNQLQVYDTATATTPELVRSVPMTGSEFRLGRDGDRLYALRTASVANVLDVTTADAPTVLGTVQSPIGFVGLDADGRDLAMAGTGLGVYRTGDLTSPTLLAYSDAFGDVLTDVAFVSTNQVMVSGGHAGVYSVGVLPPTASSGGPLARGVEIRVAPNPASGPLTVEVTVGQPSAVNVEVLDVLGRRVREIADGVAVADRAVLEWDGRDASGVRLPAGVYLVRASTEAGHLGTRAVTVVR